MTEIHYQGDAPFYESGGPLYPQNNPTSYEQPIQGDQQINTYGSNATYITPKDTMKFSIVIIFIIVGILVTASMLFVSIKNKESIPAIIFCCSPLIFLAIAIYIGIKSTILTAINISPTLGTIEVIQKKLFGALPKEK